MIALIGYLWKLKVFTIHEASSSYFFLFFTSFSSVLSMNPVDMTYFSSSTIVCFSWKFGSIIMILPVFYYAIARSCQSNPFWGIQSQSDGEKLSLTTVLRSQLSTSNILSVLSTPIDTNMSWFLLREIEVIRPVWALKFLINSMRENVFFQNLMWPSIEEVMIRFCLLDAIMLLMMSRCI